MEEGNVIAPDGGYGWVIVFCSFFINAVCNGITLALGVLYVAWLNTFNSGKSETSWVVSIAVAVMCGIGPIAAAVAVRTGYRLMTVLGSLLMSFGFLLSYFANSVFTLTVTIGVIAGTGFGLAYLPSVAVPAIYFEKRRSMALGLGTAGTGAGMFLLAPLLNILVDMYGWRGTMLFLSGICLNVCVVGSLMRPLTPFQNSLNSTTVHVTNEKETSYDLKKFDSPAQVNGAGEVNGNLLLLAMSNESIKPETKPKKQLSFVEEPSNPIPKEIQLSTEKNCTQGEINPDLTSSELPENDQDSENMQDFVQKLSSLNTTKSSKKKKSFVAKNLKGGPFRHYKSSDAPKLKRKHSLGSNYKFNSFKEKNAKNKLPNNINLTSDITSATTKPKALFIQLSDLNDELFICKLERKKSFNENLSQKSPSALSFPINNSDHKWTQSPYHSSESLPASVPLDQEVKDRLLGKSLRQLLAALPNEPEVDASRAYRSDFELNIHTSKREEKLFTSLKPRDVVTSGSIYNLMALDISLSHSRRSLYRANTSEHQRRRNTFHALMPSGDPNKGIKQKKVLDEEPRLLRSLMENLRANFNLLKDPVFLLLALSNFLTNLSFVMPTVFMVDRAVMSGISLESAAMLVSLNGVGTVCGRVGSALVADRKWLNRLLVYILALTLAGLITSLSPLCGSNLVLHEVYATCFGLLMGNYAALCACVLVDLKGLEGVGQSYGLLLVFMGIATLVGTPMAGWIYDLSGNYKVPFILHGAFITVSGLVLLPLLAKSRNSETKEPNS